MKHEVEFSQPKEPQGPNKLIHQAGRDIGRLFVDRLGVLEQDEINDLVADTRFHHFPGEAILLGFQNALSLHPDHPYVLDYFPYERNDLLPGRIALVAHGVMASLLAGGHHDVVTDKVYIDPYPTLIYYTLTNFARNEIKLEDFVISTALYMMLINPFTVPYAIYHEMIHGISARGKRTESRRFNETLTDFFARQVIRDAHHKLGRLARLSARIGKLLLNPFERKAFDYIMLRMIAARPDEPSMPLRELAAVYTGVSNGSFAALFDSYTNGQGQHVLETIDEKVPENEKLAKLEALGSI